MSDNWQAVSWAVEGSEQANPPINTLDCSHYIDAHVSQALESFQFLIL